MRCTIAKEVTFHAGHYLPNHPTCGTQHGHTYRVRVVVTGTIVNGMILDLALLKQGIKAVILSEADHQNLNEVIPYPSVENLALRWYQRLSETVEQQTGFPKDITLVSVRVWETETSYAEVSAD